jgi:hypothetical protein
MDMISPSLWKQIIQGRDVNLATLHADPILRSPDPNSHCHQHEDKLNVNPRLKCSLKLATFVNAFGRYMRVMCQRREELDLYEAANALHQYGIKVIDYFDE